ncbi:hypothetical protein ACGFYE_41885 [Streptomyces zaomyceticus]|uniref:hypothetical protein n=1 Tax=Streptomyces zaomyceticus TaxID=68286 RepID=UPI003716AF0D
MWKTFLVSAETLLARSVAVTPRRHASVQRNLFNRMIGQLYHCLQQEERFDEALAFPAPPDEAGTVAA